MNVIVIGANGKIGTQVVNLLQNSVNHQVTAMVRKEEQLEDWKRKGVNAVLADLEGNVKQLEEAMRRSDAVVFTAGSGSKTGPDKTILVDLDGAIKAIEAAENVEAKRFVMISAQNAKKREQWGEKIKHYYAAKYYADKTLMESKLDYTIIRPGLLKDDPGTGKVSVGQQIPGGAVSRANVAETVLTVLDHSNTIHQSFDLTNGETPVRDAIRSL